MHGRMGIGSHIPEVLDYVEAKGWDVNFLYDVILQSVQTASREYLGRSFQKRSTEEFKTSDSPKMMGIIQEADRICLALKGII